MPYFTNLQGVIPNTQPDQNPGWILVPDPPAVPEDKELIWLNWEWVVRDPQPNTEPNTTWKFNHTEFKNNANSNGWICYVLVDNSNTEPNANLSINIE